MSPLRSSRALLGFGVLLTSLSFGCGAEDRTDDVGDGSTATADSGISGGNGDSGAPPASSDAGGAASDASSGSADAGSASPDAGSSSSDSGSGTSQDSGAGSSDASQPQDAGASEASTSDASTGGAKFSFFVTSEAAIRDLSGDPEGFGGDLRYGETGAGAGLRGADKLCATIAESSMPGAGAKQWRAFLSASTDGAGTSPVHARDRIGKGPWYDRKGRLVGNAIADLISGTRPSQADTQIRNDLPNETGTPNHAPDGTQVDNHDTLTGSDANGRYATGANTCMDWTSITNSGGGGGQSGPSIGHSWPRSASNGANWVSEHRAGGCAKGINTMNGTSDGTATVGSGGGYGGFYCFALTP